MQWPESPEFSPHLAGNLARVFCISDMESILYIWTAFSCNLYKHSRLWFFEPSAGLSAAPQWSPRWTLPTWSDSTLVFSFHIQTRSNTTFFGGRLHGTVLLKPFKTRQRRSDGALPHDTRESPCERRARLVPQSATHTTAKPGWPRRRCRGGRRPAPGPSTERGSLLRPEHRRGTGAAANPGDSEPAR